MKQVVTTVTYLIFIYFAVLVGACMAGDAPVKQEFQSEKNKLEIVRINKYTQLGLELESGEEDSEFLFSREIAENQYIGMNFGEQDFKDYFIEDRKSKLWVSLQFVF